MTEHDVICTRAAIDRLMKVVAHGVLVSQALEVRNVAMLNVVKAHAG